MIVIITGANGFLGQHLSLFLNNKSISVIATGRGPCRIENKNLKEVGREVKISNILFLSP